MSDENIPSTESSHIPMDEDRTAAAAEPSRPNSREGSKANSPQPDQSRRGS